eukprot:NODE_1507_length_880_cov_354.858002_g1166_i0.p1 GENE.NODE_1507_length_880_cov_354.858002_g1166_i0~~NODE_1507_length_880_cov_354.858002_g1166_i0.p1  ORF type:complete len:159 (+),score=6.47 NODE_1507_length_880_cov_354.858002_g1166_i0:320-796(+)
MSNLLCLLLLPWVLGLNPLQVKNSGNAQDIEHQKHYCLHKALCIVSCESAGIFDFYEQDIYFPTSDTTFAVTVTGTAGIYAWLGPDRDHYWGEGCNGPCKWELTENFFYNGTAGRGGAPMVLMLINENVVFSKHVTITSYGPSGSLCNVFNGEKWCPE